MARSSNSSISGSKMSDEALTSEPQATPVRKLRDGRFGPLVLLAQASAAFLAVALTVWAIAVFVKDGNDYALASNLKHRALEQAQGKKIVLVGGSNLPFGTDSTIIEEATGCPVVNMGMNGYFGPRFMFEEVKPYLNAGDIVVVALEYDSYVKSVDGTNTDLLMVTKGNPATFQFLTPKQQLDVIGRYPYVAQQKVLRLMRDGMLFLSDLRKGTKTEANVIDEVETVSGFTKNGDLVSHLKIKWTGERENGLDLTKTPLEPALIPLMKDFNQDLTARGVNVMFSFTPAIDYYYAQHKAAIASYYEIEKANGLNVPRHPSEFVFTPDYHFDTVYHLGDAGRKKRAAMVAEDLIKTYGPAAQCGKPTAQPAKMTGAKQ
jgi:hypothetical protein